jgi:hypothetical protein
MGSPAFWGQLVAFESALRKPLLVPFGLFNPQDNLGFIASIDTGSQLTTLSLAYSSALSIDVSSADVISILLTGNVASTTLNYSGSSIIPIGQRVWIRYIQNSTGGWTVALPANLNYDQGFVVDPTPGRTTVLPLMYKGLSTGWVFFGEAFSVPGA